MKGNIKFILFITLLLAVVFIIQYNLPRKFSWKPTFSQYDKEPFGCYVFDDVLSSSLPNGYAVTNQDFYSLKYDSTSGLKSILSVTDYQKDYPANINALLKMVEEGNKVMLVSSELSSYLSDTLNIDVNHPYLNINLLKVSTKNNPKRDSLFLQNSSFDRQTYEFYPPIVSGYFTKAHSVVALHALDIDSDTTSSNPAFVSPPTWGDSLAIDTLAKNKDGKPVALQIKHGKGILLLVNNPLIFTNYGILDHNNADYIFSLLSYIDDLPIIRTETHLTQFGEEAESPLIFLLSNKPLRWALYFLLCVILLFMLFAAKRRQRIIPVVTPSVNRSKEFTELIGTLYFQKRNYTDLVRKKYIYFVDQIKRNTHIDIEAEGLSIEICTRLAAKTGMDETELHDFLKQLNEIKHGERLSDEKEMKSYINRMNEIINNSR